MRKLLAIVLCLAMCFGMLAMTASAAGDYYVAGVEALCGVNWDPGAAANKMTANSDGTYSITYKDVPAGTYEFKVTNGTWDQSWGDNGYNYWLQLDAKCDVTINFDPATGTITVDADAKGEVPEYVIECMSVIGQGTEDLGNWDTDLEMTETSDGIYTYTFESLTNVQMSIKLRANKDWTLNFGGAFSASGAEIKAETNGSNINFGVAEASKVTVKLDLTGYDASTKQGAVITVTITPLGGSDDNKDETNDTEDKPVEVETVTVHAKVPADWTAVSAYVWDGKGTDNSWPGVVMTKGKDGWWTAEVPVWAVNIIINNGGNGCQTQDIAIDAGKDVWVVVKAGDNGFVGTMTYEAPKTGDGTDVVALGAAMILAAAGCAALVINKNKVA